jgi:hypothetical protein
MKRIMVLALFLGIAGCETTAGDLRHSNLVLSGTSTKSAIDLITCVSEKWGEKYSDIAMLPKKNGASIKVTRGLGHVTGVVDAENLPEGGSQFKYYQRHPSTTPESMFLQPVKSCV